MRRAVVLEEFWTMRGKGRGAAFGHIRGRFFARGKVTSVLDSPHGVFESPTAWISDCRDSARGQGAQGPVAEGVGYNECADPEKACAATTELNALNTLGGWSHIGSRLVCSATLALRRTRSSGKGGSVYISAAISRASLCGLTEDNLEYVAQANSDVVKQPN